MHSFVCCADDDFEFFESKIRPVLVQHCYECHSAEAATPKGGLLLDQRDATRGGGDSEAPGRQETQGGDVGGTNSGPAVSYGLV